jgi:2-methylcitrate dehydratase PrpD
VNHPTIDGCIQIHDEHRPEPREIAAVRLRVAPLVMDLCNQRNITKGLQGKFSVYHGAALGLVRGKAGIQDYTDEAVNDPQIKRVRELVSAQGDPSITEDQAHIEVDLASGARLTRFVEQSLGNIHRPMSDQQLETKFRDQAVAALAAGQVEKAIALCWNIDELDDVAELIQAAVPKAE